MGIKITPNFLHISVPTYCTSNPCDNGGICVNTIDDYTCKCRSDNYGKNCELKVKQADKPQTTSKPNFFEVMQNLEIDSMTSLIDDDDNDVGNAVSKLAVNGIELVKNIADAIKTDVLAQK